MTEDTDDDNDGVNDFEADGTTVLDNCRLVANADQANADQANADNADDGGDACDDDDDNDAVNDPADTCSTGVPSTDNDGDGCRDTDEDPDDDNDEVADGTDNCQFVMNPDQFNNDTDAFGDACDDDDDDDGTKDAEDAFRTDACASTDTDGDGMPDSLVAGCDTDLTEDLDDDGDGFPNEANSTTVADLDDNNNGLIEIHTLDDLARLARRSETATVRMTAITTPLPPWALMVVRVRMTAAVSVMN